MNSEEPSEQKAHRHALRALHEAAKALATFRKCMWGGVMFGSFVFLWGAITFGGHYAPIVGTVYAFALSGLALIVGLSAAAMLRTLHPDIPWRELMSVVIRASVVGLIMTIVITWFLLPVT